MPIIQNETYTQEEIIEKNINSRFNFQINEKIK